MNFVFLTLCFLFFCNPLFAKEIALVYTAETHAALYPCDCPREPDGGLARRATLIEELRKGYRDSLFLDAGDFFAGGALDQYSQGPELDKARTQVNLKAMEMMKYDAVGIGEEEFNFGKEFLEEKIRDTKMPFVSCNVKAEGVSAFVLKNIAGVRVGITGVTNPGIAKKIKDIVVIEPKSAVSSAVADLKKKKAGIIILLSHLDEKENLELTGAVKGIDILIAAHGSSKAEAVGKAGNTLILKPSWQARRLDKVSLKIEQGRILSHEAEALRLSDAVRDDPGIISILPRCFSDEDCKKEGFIGNCDNPGTLDSKCLFSEPAAVSLSVITVKDCIACSTEPVIRHLKGVFPGLNVSYLYYPGNDAESLIKALGIPGLPAFLLGREAEKEKTFNKVKGNLELKGDFYVLKPEVGGISFFLGRKEVKGRLDLFLSLYMKGSKDLLGVIKEFGPAVHFLAVEEDGKFKAEKGAVESEEYLRAVCVQRYYPDSFWDYISCRAGNITDGRWEQCAPVSETDKINACSQGNGGVSLLRKNIELNKELGIMFGPTYLLDNQRIFSSNGAPSKEELNKIIKR